MSRFILSFVRKEIVAYLLSLCVEDISSENFQRWEYPDTCKGAQGKPTAYFILSVSRLMRASSLPF